MQGRSGQMKIVYRRRGRENDTPDRFTAAGNEPRRSPGKDDEMKIIYRRRRRRSDVSDCFAGIASTGKKAQELLIDYAVHFVKANGATRPKVFKLRKLALSPGDRLELGGMLSFKDLTTRRHYPGRHRIDLLINGIPQPLGEFDVQLGPRRARGRTPVRA
jgi:hypothetical protein